MKNISRVYTQNSLLLKNCNLLNFQNKFADEQACIDWLINQRFGSKENITCSYCGFNKVYKFKNGKTFKCAYCLKKLSIRIGTIFEKSKVPLFEWFFAIYLFTSFKKVISSIQLSKYIGVTQKTAWSMLQRIRVAMEDETIEIGVTENNTWFMLQTTKVAMEDKTIEFEKINYLTKQQVIKKYYDKYINYKLVPDYQKDIILYHVTQTSYLKKANWKLAQEI
jgi:hypothetical protein